MNYYKQKDYKNAINTIEAKINYLPIVGSKYFNTITRIVFKSYIKLGQLDKAFGYIEKLQKTISVLRRTKMFKNYLSYDSVLNDNANNIIYRILRLCVILALNMNDRNWAMFVLKSQSQINMHKEQYKFNQQQLQNNDEDCNECNKCCFILNVTSIITIDIEVYLKQMNYNVILINAFDLKVMKCITRLNMQNCSQFMLVAFVYSHNGDIILCTDEYKSSGYQVKSIIYKGSLRSRESNFKILPW